MTDKKALLPPLQNQRVDNQKTPDFNEEKIPFLDPKQDKLLLHALREQVDSGTASKQSLELAEYIVDPDAPFPIRTSLTDFYRSMRSDYVKLNFPKT